MTPKMRNDFIRRLSEVKKQENEDQTDLMDSIQKALGSMFGKKRW